MRCPRLRRDGEPIHLLVDSTGLISDALRSRTDERRATEMDVAVHALNRMSDLGRPSYVRIA